MKSPPNVFHVQQLFITKQHRNYVIRQITMSLSPFQKSGILQSIQRADSHGHKHLESFEMWCNTHRRIETVYWPDRVKNGVLRRVKNESNILHTRNKRKD